MEEELLKQLYIHKKKSVAEIASLQECSQSKVNFWLRKHNIRKRTISEAIYSKSHPYGDPFVVRIPKNIRESCFIWSWRGLILG
jgi:hypothetical protein